VIESEYEEKARIPDDYEKIAEFGDTRKVIEWFNEGAQTIGLFRLKSIRTQNQKINLQKLGSDL
jgi:hypothetical protein